VPRVKFCKRERAGAQRSPHTISTGGRGLTDIGCLRRFNA